MRLEYTLTLDDYKSAVHLHARQTAGRRAASFFLSKVLPGIGFLLLAAQAFLAFKERDYLSHNPPGLLVVPVVLLLLPVIQANSVRRQFNQLFPTSARSLLIDIDDERIICVNPGSSEVRFMWKTILGFAQDEKITMIYVARLKFLFFPTSSMSGSDRSELDRLIARNMLSKEAE